MINEADRDQREDNKEPQHDQHIIDEQEIFTQVPRLRHAGHFPSREIKDEHFLFCIAAKTFPITSGTIFFYQNVALIESFYQICE
ncbi:TPA: hypothetical protein M2D13_002351 [Escherichia coli]|nr:hypothetical protein [Escherichia coli]HCB7879687.1 hypothetical protein [Escherichia coli]